MKLLATLLLLISPFFSLLAQNGYKINIRLQHYPTDSILIGHKYGHQQLIDQTVSKNGLGDFLFEGRELPSGIYFILLKPTNEFIEFLIGDNNRHFSISADAKDLAKSTTFQNSRSNTAFQEYIATLTANKQKITSLTKELQLHTAQNHSFQRIQTANKLNEVILSSKAYADQFTKTYQGTLAANIAECLKEIDLPDFQGDSRAVLQQKYDYTKNHYFDHLDFSKKWLLYTNFVDDKINYYLNELIEPIPDTISHRVDELLQKMQANPEIYRFYLVKFINQYAHSKEVGYDAIFVHITQKYLKNKTVEGLDSTVISQIVRSAELAAPVLIGKKAPNMTLYLADGTPKSIFDVKKDYTVLFFWGPNCGYCDKAAPFLVDFHKKYKDLVNVITICTQQGEAAKQCHEKSQAHDFTGMINLSDPNYTSSFFTLYYVQATPTIYILGKDKTILSKGFLAKDLGAQMDLILGD